MIHQPTTRRPASDDVRARRLADHRDEPKRIFTSYTAMLTLRRLLSQRYDLPEMGTDAPEEAKA